MRLIHREIAELPRLAWLAVVNQVRKQVTTLHGVDVETREDGLVEGVWDAPFSESGFVESESFFGSGLRVDDHGVTLVPSRALIDRILLARGRDVCVASNSLALALFALKGSLVPGHSYADETFTILKGIRRYRPEIAATIEGVETLQQRFFFPFRIMGDDLEIIDATPPRSFIDFGDYYGTLQRTVEAILANSTDPARRFPLTPRVTLSRGYDSPAAGALAARFATPVAYTARRSNSALPGWLNRAASHDDATEIAIALGLPVRYLGPDTVPFDPRFFFAGGTGDPELVFGSLAGDVAASTNPSLLISGYHGDKVWALDPGAAYLGDELKRGDTSGLALTEARLVAGWVNFAVPFIGARSIDSLVRISQSEEMRPWSVGGSYDRPIPRRIAEEAGIPREAFGERKRAVVQTLVAPHGRTLRADFASWLRDSEGQHLIRHRLAAGVSLTRWAALRAVEKLGGLLGLTIQEPDRWALLRGGDPTSLLFRWAVERLSGESGPFPAEIRDLVRNVSGDA